MTEIQEVNEYIFNNKNNLDFRPFGQIVGIGKDITWQDVLTLEEEYICSLKEPPTILMSSLYNGLDTFNTITSKSLKNIQLVIDKVILGIETNYIAAYLEEKKCIENDIYYPPEKYENPIETINVKKRNPFDWTICVKHATPKKQQWLENDVQNEDFYENCIKKDNTLYGTIEVGVYRIEQSDTNEYGVIVNRLTGRSQVVYDFCKHLKNALLE